jgi:hypothetical protein
LYIASASPSAPASMRAKRCDAVLHTANCSPRLDSDPNASRGATVYGFADGDAEAMYKTMAANAIASSRFVSAGVVALTRSQEYGYSLLYAG